MTSMFSLLMVLNREAQPNREQQAALKMTERQPGHRYIAPRHNCRIRAGKGFS
jgi:hypothetical protein